MSTSPMGAGCPAPLPQLVEVVRTDILLGKHPNDGRFTYAFCLERYGNISRADYELLFCPLAEEGYVRRLHSEKSETSFSVSCLERHLGANTCMGFQFEAEILSDQLEGETLIASLVELNERLACLVRKHDSGSRVEFGRLDYDFHAVLATASRRGGAEEIVRRYRGAILVCPGPLNWTERNRVEIVCAHDRLVEALTHRDTLRAYTALACDYRTLGRGFLSPRDYQKLEEVTS